MVILPSWTLKWYYKNTSSGWGWRNGGSVWRPDLGSRMLADSVLALLKQVAKGLWRPGLSWTSSLEAGSHTRTMSLVGDWVYVPSPVQCCPARWNYVPWAIQATINRFLINLEVCKWFCCSNFVFPQTDALKIVENKCIQRHLSAHATAGRGYQILLWPQGLPCPPHPSLLTCSQPTQHSSASEGQSAQETFTPVPPSSWQKRISSTSWSDMTVLRYHH